MNEPDDEQMTLRGESVMPGEMRIYEMEVIVGKKTSYMTIDGLVDKVLPGCVYTIMGPEKFQHASGEEMLKCSVYAK